MQIILLYMVYVLMIALMYNISILELALPFVQRKPLLSFRYDFEKRVLTKCD
jgi:hypothetical protein